MTTGFVIFAGEPPRERPPIFETEAEPPVEPPPPALACEAQLLAVLAGAPRAGETIEGAFRRKEQEIGALFAGLTPAELLIVQRMLATESEPLGAAFARLNEARRERLLAFVARRRRP